MKILEKEQARQLRRQGLSINQIVEHTGCAKSSISIWVRDIILTKSQRGKMSKRGRSVESIERRRISRLRNIEKKRQIIIDHAKKDFYSISLRELKLIGAILYWGEGGKTGNWSVRIANSDPRLIKVIMRFFREVCRVSEDKFHAHIHTFDNSNVEKAERYWSKISGVPREQFYKTYVKKSIASLHKSRSLPHGTLDIYVHDTKLFLTIMGWIDGIVETLLF